jgi:uncharacterized protein
MYSELGNISKNKNGTFITVKKRYPLSYIHGGISLGKLLETSRDNISLLMAKDNDYSDISNALFIDTETTGLSGGAGTVAFLIGTGFFDNDMFVVKQFFMRDYDEENALLTAFNELLSGYSMIVTFNGKAFDWNLILSRFIFNRIKPSINEPVNIDLLYPARRIWKNKLENCRLINLEEKILGEFRDDDIPGELIPSMYFNYIENRDTVEIKKIFHHNRLDILSMVSLLKKLCSMIERPFEKTDGNHELLGAGRIFEFNEEYDISIECLEKCLHSKNGYIRQTATRRLSYMYKKKQDYQKAVKHWKGMISQNRNLSMFPVIELAKYYEHKEKNPGKALDIVKGAVRTGLLMENRNKTYFYDIKKRIARLEKKLRG